MVAVDEAGKPSPVPEWIPQTQEDQELRASAIRLMNMRTEIGEEMEAHVKYLKIKGYSALTTGMERCHRIVIKLV